MKTINPDGCYEIYFYEDEKKKVIFVDDNIPTQKGHFYFAKPTGEELWALVLEKVFAKYEGGYSTINGGSMFQEFGFFTETVGKLVQNL